MNIFFPLLGYFTMLIIVINLIILTQKSIKDTEDKISEETKQTKTK